MRTNEIEKKISKLKAKCKANRIAVYDDGFSSVCDRIEYVAACYAKEGYLLNVKSINVMLSGDFWIGSTASVTIVPFYRAVRI